MNIKSTDECRFDELSPGEIMLRLDPGEGRIHPARQFRAWEGGGEYNVAHGLRRCFGLRTAVVIAYPNFQAVATTLSQRKNKYNRILIILYILGNR